MREVTLLVDEETAERIESASPTMKEKILRTLARTVRDDDPPAERLIAHMEAMHERARANGMTEEIEQELLKELEELS